MQTTIISFWDAACFWYWTIAYCSAAFYLLYFLLGALNTNRLVKPTLWCAHCGKPIVVLVTQIERKAGVDHLGKGHLTTSTVKSYETPHKCPRCGSQRELLAYNPFYGLVGSFLGIFGRYGLFGKMPVFHHAVFFIGLSVLHKIELMEYALVLDVLLLIWSACMNPVLTEELMSIAYLFGLAKDKERAKDMLGSISVALAVRFLEMHQTSGEPCTFAALKEICKKHGITVSDREAHKFFQVTDKLLLTEKQGGEERNSRFVTPVEAKEIRRELLKFSRATKGELDPGKALRINRFDTATPSPDAEGEGNENSSKENG